MMTCEKKCGEGAIARDPTCTKIVTKKKVIFDTEMIKYQTQELVWDGWALGSMVHHVTFDVPPNSLLLSLRFGKVAQKRTSVSALKQINRGKVFPKSWRQTDKWMD